MKKGTGLLLALLPFVTAAEILVSDGFPVGEGGYGDGQVALRSQTITDESVVGWSWQMWNNGGGSGVLYSFGADSGLSFPSLMTEHGFTAVGASAGLHAKEAGNPRVAEKKFMIANPGEREKIYFRCLVSADQTCVDNISTPTASTLLTATTSYVTGLSTSWNTDSGKYDYLFTTKGNMLFGIARNQGGNVELDLCVIDAAGTKSVYTLVPSDSFAAGKTYICVLELTIGAGTDGKEQVRAFACDIEKYSPALGWAPLGGDSRVVEAEVWSETAYPQYIAICGRYQNNNGYFKVDEFVLATELDDVAYWNENFPMMSNAFVAGTADGLTVSATMEKNSAQLTALAYATDSSDPVVTEFPEVVSEGETASVALAGLAADTTYRIEIVAENEAGTVTKELGTAYTGVPMITVLSDADEDGFKKGSFKLARADASASLVVNYACGGSAVSGVNYEAFPETVTIPAGEMEAVVEVSPLIAAPHDRATVLELSLASGNYPLGDEPPSATMTIENLAPPAEFNVWIAPADGNASEPTNWSKGRVPQSTDDILVNGDFSMAALNWDGATAGMPESVASWTQTASYTNRVVMPTTRSGAFTNLVITGSATLNGGEWWRPSNTKNDDNTAKVWLNVRIGNDLTTGKDFTFNAYGTGFFKSRGPSPAQNQGRGGSHGGSGAGSSYVNGTVYGDYARPTSLGSGSYGSMNYYGGGAVVLTVGGVFVHQGTIIADGGDGSDNAAPSGGSILIETSRLEGDGVMSAEGGSPSGKRSGGGGGRIGIHVTEAGSDYVSFTNKFLGLLSATGGAGPNGDYAHNIGAAGTIYVETRSDNGSGRLFVRNRDWKFTKGTLAHNAVTPVPESETWDLSSVNMCDNARLGVYGTLKVPSFAAITAEGVEEYSLLLFAGGSLQSALTHDTLTAKGFGVATTGTNDFGAHNLEIPETSTLTVEGALIVGNLKLNGTKLAAGEYAASSLAETYPNVSGAGAIKVLGLSDGLMLFVR